MKRRKHIGLGKWIVLSTAAISICAVGGTYAAWADTLNVTAGLTTGSFDTVLGNRTYTVELLDSSGNSTIKRSVTQVEVIPASNGKSAEITFSQLPLEEMLEGQILRLTVPLESKGTFKNIRRYEPDFEQKPDETITLNPQNRQLYVISNGQIYKPNEETDLSQYTHDPELELFRSFEGKPDALTASIYLRLPEKSRTQMQALQEEGLTFAPQELEELTEHQIARQATLNIDTTQDGILAGYRCTIPILIDQHFESE